MKEKRRPLDIIVESLPSLEASFENIRAAEAHSDAEWERAAPNLLWHK